MASQKGLSHALVGITGQLPAVRLLRDDQLAAVALGRNPAPDWQGTRICAVGIRAATVKQKAQSWFECAREAVCLSSWVRLQPVGSG